MFGDFDSGSAESGSAPAAIAAIPIAAPRSTDLRVMLSDEQWSDFRCWGGNAAEFPSLPLLVALFSAGMRRTYQTPRHCANRLVVGEAKKQKSIDDPQCSNQANAGFPAPIGPVLQVRVGLPPARLHAKSLPGKQLSLAKNWVREGTVIVSLHRGP